MTHADPSVNEKLILKPMPAKAVFRLAHAVARARALSAVEAAPDGHVVEIKPPNRSLEQNSALHGALSDIAEQVTWHGQKFSVEVWKRLVTAAWLREQNEQPMLVPALDGNGFDMIFQRTSRLTVAQMSSLMDWVLAFAAQHDVTLHEPAREVLP